MKLPSLILFITLIVLTITEIPKIETPVNSINRPLFHFTPPYGWMNDPNGLWYDATEEVKKWHLYYQYNPNGKVWDLPLYWGHATSTDLITWVHEDVAVSPPEDKSGAYSGSAVVDEENTSGFFGASTLPNTQWVIAIWTFNAADWYESQYVSYSNDAGTSFKHYRMNPVISMNSKQFRDPQVIRYNGEAGKFWVMSVAKSHQYKIQFYKSTNLKNWKPIGSFSLYGFLGYQYECPNLAKMQYKGTQTTWSEKVEKETIEKEGEQIIKNYLWVLFISINPGSMQGGSSTQYFIGNFDGTNFTPIKNYAAPIDYGKDFYALQLFFNSPDGDIYGVAWASNWQYCATVPTDNWRSSMSLVRRLTIDDFESAKNTKIAFIKSEPITEINNGKLRYGEKTYTFNSNEQKLNAFYPTYTLDISDQVSGALEFTCEFTVYGDTWTKHNPAHFYLDFKGYAIPEEYLRLGYEGEAGAFFIDRGHTNVQWVHDNPYFTDKLSVHIQPIDPSADDKKYKVHGFIDRNIIELYFNDGFQTSTNTFFMTGGNFIGTVDIKLNKIAYNEEKNSYFKPFDISLSVQQILGTDGE